MGNPDKRQGDDSRSAFTSRLIHWYSLSARSLPWRGHPDPYAVWVSEIMLQQTRVETVIPYFERWMGLFPTLATLAEADQSQVLNAWEGLGYYSRARNLHRAAQVVMAEHGGSLPSDVHALRRLPGIGAYTAAAIASIAFGKDEAALDGNIRRVLARVFDITAPLGTPDFEKNAAALAAELLPAGHAGDYNQALMDLGASICTPRSPDCANCPVNNLCLAFAGGVQTQRPQRKPRKETPHYQVTAAIIQRNGQIFIARRPQQGLLAGLWEFPGGKQQPGESLPQALRREIKEELDAEIEVGAGFGIYQHAYTHFSITLHAFEARLASGSEPQPLEHSETAWVQPGALAHYPMGKVDRQIARRLMEAAA